MCSLRPYTGEAKRTVTIPGGDIVSSGIFYDQLASRAHITHALQLMYFSFSDMANNNRSAGSTPKPNYNKHFPRSFLLNYGEALQDLPDDKILARLKDWNCEWLSRPNIGMSEMAATLKDNWDNIPRHRGTVFTPSFVDKLESFCSPIIPALRRLDNKDRYSNEAPDKDDILDVIEAIHKDEATETMFMEAFNACGPVLMMAIHVIAFNCLLHNPDALAEQSVKNAATDALPTHKSSITGKAKWVFQPEFIIFFCYRQVLNHARYFTFRIIRLCINMYCKNPHVLDPLRKLIVLRSNRMIG